MEKRRALIPQWLWWLLWSLMMALIVTTSLLMAAGR